MCYTWVYMCFVELKKAYDLVPVLSGTLREYGVQWLLLQIIWSLYDEIKSCVCILGPTKHILSDYWMLPRLPLDSDLKAQPGWAVSGLGTSELHLLSLQMK